MQYILSNWHLSITVDTHGAELVSLQKWDHEYLYQKQEGFWQRQSPVLFPIVGALSGWAFEYGGKIYPMSQHGFARDREFELVSRTEDTLVFKLASDGASREIYPFDFTLSLIYTLDTDGLKVTYEVKNTGSEEMYFSLGWHPAFALGGDVSLYSVVFEDDRELRRWYLKNWLLDSYEIINTQNWILPLSEEIFSDDALVLPSLKSETIALQKNGETILSLHRGNMPHFGVWRQSHAPFLCLEPWQWYASENTNMVQQLSEKEWIMTLKPHEQREWWWSVSM